MKEITKKAIKVDKEIGKIFIDNNVTIQEKHVIVGNLVRDLGYEIGKDIKDMWIKHYDFIAVKFELVGEKFYYIVKDRYNESNVIAKELSLTQYENEFLIVDFNDLPSKGDWGFRRALFEAIS